MTVESLAMSTVKLLADQVKLFANSSIVIDCQVLMLDTSSVPMSFLELNPEDTDLTMFTIQNITLSENSNMVYMALKLKRKVATELLTTYLPTILLLLITFVTMNIRLPITTFPQCNAG